MNEKKLKSGAVLGLQLGSLEESTALLDAILAEMVGLKIEGFGTNIDLKDLIGKDLWQLKDVLFKVISSKAVKEALWSCMTSCTYQAPGAPVGERINREQTFQSEKTRGDFFPVAGEVATFNLAPFFANLVLPSSIQEKLDLATGKSPASETG